MVLPCTLWGIHRDPDRTFMVFSLFDAEQMITSKALYINHYLEYKICIYNQILCIKQLKELDVDFITELLNTMDNYKICLSFNNNRNAATKTIDRKCEIVITDDSSTLCQKCLLLENE